jgi:hypothetical protein
MSNAKINFPFLLPILRHIYSLIARKDLRDIFDQLSVTRKNKITLNSDKSRSAPELFQEKPEKRKIGMFNYTLFVSSATQ